MAGRIVEQTVLFVLMDTAVPIPSLAVGAAGRIGPFALVARKPPRCGSTNGFVVAGAQHAPEAGGARRLW